MSYAAIQPTGQVTDEARAFFKLLARTNEPRGTVMWSLMGAEQVLIRDEGCFRKEGRYMLGRVAKSWSGGELYCASTSPKEKVNNVLYYAHTEFGVVLASSRKTLETLLPNTEVLIMEGAAQ
jgi:hypothetical protein